MSRGVARRAGTLAAAALAALAACRGEPPRAAAQESLGHLVESLRAPVERAVGLRFKAPPRSAMRTREQVRAYLVRQLDRELPPRKLAGVEAAYRLLGLLPDTVGLRPLLLDVFSEQVAGYYDPDSATLFGVAGADPTQLRLVLAHELVHALQGQYLPLDSILHSSRDSDRLAAAQAVLEGQATLASIEVLAPGQSITARPEFWEAYRDQIRAQQSAMPAFARAPLVVRHSLIFPYLAGAEFVRWWEASGRGDTVPFGRRMPVSTEQILHPARYAAGDAPVAVALTGGPEPLHEDVLGEAEIRVLEAVLAGRDEVPPGPPLGWAGDRYRAYRTSDGPALVWVAAWDDAAAAERFRRGPAERLRARPRPGYRVAVDTLSAAGRPAVRVALAPERWDGWRAPLPAARGEPR